jgi:ABC-2 type transport system ATP-binding protein
MITLVGLTKRYGDVTAVADLSFEVSPGRVTGFLGPNGAGKSTTMRMMVDLDHPTAGTVRIDGCRYRELRHPLREVGALLDAHNTHPGRSARAHLRALARSNGIGVGRVEKVLETVGLTDVAGKQVGGFSLGMAQRLGIAAALLGDPGTLILDEPLNGLDPDGVRWVRTLLRSMAAEGRTVLLSSHLMSEMQLTADHLVVIGRGRLVADQPLSDLIGAGPTASVHVQVPDGVQRDRLHRRLTESGASVRQATEELIVTGADVRQVGDAAFETGARLHGLHAESGTLEDAYLTLTATELEYGGRR